MSTCATTARRHKQVREAGGRSPRVALVPVGTGRDDIRGRALQGETC